VTRAPRIDTMRNRIDATISLLAMARDELEDLHVLAYERHTAASDAKVSGGARDYALDTHGDLRARDAYRRLGDAIVGGPGLVGVCDLLAGAAHDMTRVLRVGQIGRNPSRRVSALELAEALEAQAIRVKRGEYTPVRVEKQPDLKRVSRAVADLREERDRLAVGNERLKTRLQRNGSGKHKGGWRREPKET
jgi:hypothetical protein